MSPAAATRRQPVDRISATGILYPLMGISHSVPLRAALEDICAALKISVATLRDAELPFLLGGSVAVWARGGPEPRKDLDLMVRPEHTDAALEALAATGMRTERPPEEWLFKAWYNDVLIDLIFGPSGLELDDDVFARGDEIPILAVNTPVMALEDVLVTKLRSLDEHGLDYEPLVAIARSLREQIDWRSLWERTSDSPFARAFFTLAEGLEIAPPRSASAETPSASSRVRVLRD